MSNLHIIHIALQGCLRAHDVDYGLTPDTGGHIRYLLDLISAVRAVDPRVQTTVVTRAFDDPALGADYRRLHELVGDGFEIVRLRGETSKYLPKESLHTEWSALVDDFQRRLGPPRPGQLVHAHYADAGVVAAASGRPFVFTAHSLGRVKQQLGGDAPASVSMPRRIEAEELAIERADAVIVSSGDEQERQLGLYHARPRQCRVIPPGCDLESLRRDAAHASKARVRDELRRFLRDPERPMVLAIARPVARKNLTGLLDAYAGSDLRQHCNLVLVAGLRERLGRCDTETRAQLEALLHRIDDHDLYGHVAMPKEHRPEDVAVYYELARASGGVFVNPALHEPFGLTVVEAAAAGLPAVVTDQGAPLQTVEHCGHGVAVDPSDPRALAREIRTLLLDPTRWRACSTRGRERARAYRWDAHAECYLELLRGIVAHHERAPYPDASAS